MAKICTVCKQKYADELAVCPNCSSAIEIVLGDPVRPPSGAKLPTTPPIRLETGSDSEIEIDLGKLPPPVPGQPDSAISDVKWSALVSKSSDSGVDLTAQGITVDSPSDAALLGGKKSEPATPKPAGGSWADIGVELTGKEPSGIVVQGGMGIVVDGSKVGISPTGPGSGSDDDIDLARLEAESKTKPTGMPSDGSGVVVEGSPQPSARQPFVETGSASDIDFRALAAGSGISPFPEQLMPDDGSEVDFGQSNKKAADGPSGLDLVAEAIESGVDLAGKKPAAGPGDSGVDLTALFDEEPPQAKKGKQPAPRPTEASSVDLGAMLPGGDSPVAKGWKTPASSDRKKAGSDVQLAGSDVGLADSGSQRSSQSDVQLTGSGSGLQPRSSDVQLAGSDVGLTGSSSGKQPRSSDVQLAGGSSSGKLGESDVQLAGSDVGLAGSSRGRRGRSGESDVQLAGSDVGLADSGVDLGGLAVGDEGDDEPPRRTVVPAPASRGMGGLTGGLIGAVLGTAACAGIYFSGLLPGSQGSTTAPVLGANEAEVKSLRSEVARLQPLETEIKDKAELVEKLEAQLATAATAAKDGVGKEVLAKALEARKQAEAQAEKAAGEAEVARKQAASLTVALDEAKKAADPKAMALLKQDADAARKQVASLTTALDEAKKAADPKALELLKKEREEATQKIAEIEKGRKAADLKVAALEKEVKTAEKMAADLMTASKAAQAKADEAAVLVTQLRKQETALTAALAEAKKAADPKALELLKKDREAATQKIAELEKERKAADQKVTELTLALKEAKGGKPDAAMQKMLDTARLEAADATKRLGEATKKLQAVETLVDAAKVNAAKARQEAVAAQATVKDLKDLLAKSAAGQRIELPAEAVDPLEAEMQYSSGRQAFHGGNYADAERAFFEAARHGGHDARYHYFLGLARFQQGKSETAEADFREAARLERQSKPGRASVNAALERIQGPARQALERARQ